MKQVLVLGLTMALVISTTVQGAGRPIPAIPVGSVGGNQGGTVRTSRSCIAVVKAAALGAMGQSSAQGQIYTSGDPMVFSPHLLRVDINADEYEVDVNIDDSCHVLSTSVVRAANGPP